MTEKHPQYHRPCQGQRNGANAVGAGSRVVPGRRLRQQVGPHLQTGQNPRSRLPRQALQAGNSGARGLLVEADKIKRSAVTLAAMTRSAFEKIPDKLADRLAAEAEPAACHALLTAEIDQVLADLADSCRNFSAEGCRWARMTASSSAAPMAWLLGRSLRPRLPSRQQRFSVTDGPDAHRLPDQGAQAGGPGELPGCPTPPDHGLPLRRAPGRSASFS